MLLNDLSKHIAAYRECIDRATARVIDRAWFILGPELQAFEDDFAEYIGVNFCRGLANGTDALELGLRAVGVQKGDLVATVANAGFYTSTALLAIGARPMYLDVDLDTRVLNRGELYRAIEGGVKALVVTHLYGQAVADMEEIARVCRSSDVLLLEDCAQAHGAKVGGKRVGSFGEVGCFSFYPTKNLGALGDAGALVCADQNIAERVAQLRQYGWTSKYSVELPGSRNSRLDELQAAILREFLPHLDTWNDWRRKIAENYTSRIVNPLIGLPKLAGEDYVAHLYVICVAQRNSLRTHLTGLNISTDVHYPIPDYHQTLNNRQYDSMVLRNTELLSQEVLTLPCFPEMTMDEVGQVIDAVNSWKP
jgi:dTDP-4-amino-4,6-dideoxygalactose transaminase